MRTHSLAASFVLATLVTTAANAAPVLRVSVDQQGDFLLIGNTFGYECAAGTPAPVVGAATCAGSTNTADSSPDLYWQSDNPGTGQATASLAVTPTSARSTAVLTIPPGATVTHAFLYWGAALNTADTSIVLDRPGTGGFSQVVTSVASWTLSSPAGYQSVADVTALVQANGSGAYRVSGVNLPAVANVNDNNLFGGWSLVVLYRTPADPLRNLTIFEGLDVVSNGSPQLVTLSGFRVPNSGFTGKLGVIAYEGDSSITGDQLFFNGGAALSNAQNPANNFFNGTRSTLGVPVSVAGDLPRLTGAAQSMSGMDLDVVDVTSKLTAGQTSATVQATSTGDTYYLGAFITSISTFKPNFSTSTKTATDVNGAPLLGGDILRYTITVTNTGNDASINTVVSDALPAGVTYVPGSISVAGVTKSDATGDDQCEYDASLRKVTCRVGTGATATTGGSLAVGGSVTVTLDVRVNTGFTGSLENQASISAAGLLGAPSSTTPTDGNGTASGAPPTTTLVDGCGSNSDCSTATPICDTSVSPKVCVACLADTDCGSATSEKVCAPSKTCVTGCRGTGGNGCATTSVCTSTDATIGNCVQCLTDSHCGGTTSGSICDPTTSTCVSGCRGAGGNGCAPPTFCTSTDATAGKCVGCRDDADCGNETSGRVCDATTSACVDGCRGTGGNGCATSMFCTSTDATIGKCIACREDADCGGATSGRICDAATNACIDGCRGAGGNGCAAATFCTSTDATAGTCVACRDDADCGDTTSGRVCDAATSTCTNGCRGSGGNGCKAPDVCSSTDATIGTCGTPSDAGVESDSGTTTDAGNTTVIDEGAVESAAGCTCSVPTSQTRVTGLAWLGLAAAAALARRRRS